MRLLNNPKTNRGTASVAQVSFSGPNGFGAVAAYESRGMPVFAPHGISYRPREGDRLLILSVDGAEICAGCLVVSPDIEPGELKLRSDGGAEIYMKNNGEIILNGLRITKAGKLIEA